MYCEINSIYSLFSKVNLQSLLIVMIFFINPSQSTSSIIIKYFDECVTTLKVYIGLAICVLQLFFISFVSFLVSLSFSSHFSFLSYFLFFKIMNGLLFILIILPFIILFESSLSCSGVWFVLTHSLQTDTMSYSAQGGYR